jgi:hypothetical protein
MIQDIRNFLLKEGSKNVFFYLVALAVVGPSIFVVFDFQRDKAFWGRVGSYLLKRKDFYLKYRDHVSFVSKVKGAIGESSSRKFLSFMLGGLTDEQYVASSEIKNGFYLNSFFSSGFDSSFFDAIVSDYISSGDSWKRDFGLYGDLIENALSSDSAASLKNLNSGILTSDSECFLDGLFSMRFSRAFFSCMSFCLPAIFSSSKLPDRIVFNVKSFKKEDVSRLIFKNDLTDERLKDFYSRGVEAGGFLGGLVKKFKFFSFARSSGSKRAFEERLGLFVSRFSSVEEASRKIQEMEGFLFSGEEVFEVEAANLSILSHKGDLKEEKIKIDFVDEDFFVLEGESLFYVFVLEDVVSLPVKSFENMYDSLKKQYSELVYSENNFKISSVLSSGMLAPDSETRVVFSLSDFSAEEKYSFLFDKNFAGISSKSFFLGPVLEDCNVDLWAVQSIVLASCSQNSSIKKNYKKGVRLALDSVVECFIRSDNVEIFR